MIENDDPKDDVSTLTLEDFGFKNFDDPSHPNYDDPNGPFYTLNDYGRPLEQEHRTRRLRMREVRARMAKWSPEECLAYLVELGTHNPDGTVAEIYTLPYKYGPFAGKE